jgi:hypothetical protein
MNLEVGIFEFVIFRQALPKPISLKGENSQSRKFYFGRITYKNSISK